MSNDINKDDIIDVEYTDLENIIYISSVQMAKKVGTTESTIRTWFEYYGDLFNAKKISGRKTYKETEVRFYNFIKDLTDKNMKREQIRDFINKYGFEFPDDGLMDIQQPMAYEALSSAITLDIKEELNNKLEEFTEKIIQQVTNKLNNHLESQTMINYELKAEIESSVSDVVSNIVESKLNQNKDAIVEELTGKIDEMEKSFTDLDNERISNLKKHMDERFKQNELSKQQKKKGLLSWFKRG